jgi:protease-4
MNRAMPLLFSLTLLSGCAIHVHGFGEAEPLEERVLAGRSGPKIVVLDVEGFITDESVRQPLTGNRLPGPMARIREALDLAAKDEEVGALLLRIRSPGGTVSASETLHHEIRRWKTGYRKPVFAYLDGLATSGGYYVALASDRIVAHPTTVTGSIGVLMLGLDLTGLMQKVGVKDRTVTSGPYKDAGSWLRTMRPEEREQIQSVVDDLYDRFKVVVTQGRPGLSAPDVDRLSDGRVYSASQALDAGLIDAIGYLDDVARALGNRLGAAETRLVSYEQPRDYRANYYAERATRIDVNVLSIGRQPLPPGFYYVWPAALGIP